MGVLEPIHGSLLKHTGKSIANPVAAIMAAKMMISHLGESPMAFKIEQTVKDALLEGKMRPYNFGGCSQR